MTDKKAYVLITGAGGYLGGALFRQLEAEGSFKPLALTSDKDKTLKTHGNMIRVFDYRDLADGSIPWSEIDTIVHAAFCRESNGSKLVESLRLTEKMAHLASQNQVSGFVNISTQGVYGTSPPPWNENTALDPYYLYAMAKYSSELLVKNTCGVNTFSTSIRLAGLAGGLSGVKQGVLSTFVQNALNGQPLRLAGGNQVLSIIDVRDAVFGLSKFINTPKKYWDGIYNLGCNWTCTVQEIAETVKNVSARYNCPAVAIQVEDKGAAINSGLDANAFYQIAGWTPTYTLEDIVVSLFEYFMQCSK